MWRMTIKSNFSKEQAVIESKNIPMLSIAYHNLTGIKLSEDTLRNIFWNKTSLKAFYTIEKLKVSD